MKAMSNRKSHIPMISGCFIGLAFAYCYYSRAQGVWSWPVAVCLGVLFGLVVFWVFRRDSQKKD
jgi:uncharacterized membrane protein (UPF0136 family)